MENKAKKPLPFLPTKSEVYDIYRKINNKIIRTEMNEIMAKHRKKSVDEVKFKQTMFHAEFVSLVQLFGIPDNYYVPDNFFDEAK